MKQMLSPPRPMGTIQTQALLLLGATLIINQYDIGILTLALPKIQESLNIAEQDVGKMLAILRLGEIPALFLAIFADCFGRRRVLMTTIVGFIVCSSLTAFAPNMWSFVALQFLAQMFLSTEFALAFVVIIESLEPANRGWGIGVLAAFGAFGQGLSSIMYAFVDSLPYGWRSLYLISIVPLLLLARLRRNLKETEEFSQIETQSGRKIWKEFIIPVKQLLISCKKHFAIMFVVLFTFWFCFSTVTSFIPKHLQNVHKYTPAQVSILYICGGVLAILANIIAGRLSDLFGRRKVLLSTMALLFIATALFFRTSVTWVGIAWTIFLISFLCTDVILRALQCELFPAHCRSTATKTLGLCGNLGAAIGLAIEGYLFTYTQSHESSIMWMLLVPVISFVVIFYFVPETSSKNLEQILSE